MADSSEKLVRFDWAIRYILRDKANFDILEGFLTALLNEDIKVLSILDTESNQEDSNDKFNRVDILIEDSQKRKVIIEVQNNRESNYIERLLYGTSKVIVENIDLGDSYNKVVKVLSISIVYFNLGLGDDYIYYGKTNFIGVHTKAPLIIKEKVEINSEVFGAQVKIKMNEKDVFPEYYLIRVEKFEDVIQSPIDEWIYMLKHSEIRQDFNSKNIDKAREKLNVMKMEPEEKKRYKKYIENLKYEQNVLKTAREDGKNEEKINTEKEKQRAEKEKQRAEKERQRAEKAEKDKEQEKQRAEKERQRAEKAEKDKEQEKQKLDSAILKMIQKNILSIEEIADMFGVSSEYIKSIRTVES